MTLKFYNTLLLIRIKLHCLWDSSKIAKQNPRKRNLIDCNIYLMNIYIFFKFKINVIFSVVGVPIMYM